MSKFCALFDKRPVQNDSPKRNRAEHAFTFAELLAAMLFVAIVIPVALRGIMVANRLAVVAERKLQAVQLADLKLNELILTQEWQSATNQGDFGQDWPEYRWVMRQETWAEDSMQQLTLSVIFTVQQQEYSVSLMTLVSDEESS